MVVFEKPIVAKKLRDFHRYLRQNEGKIGTKVRGIDMNINNACNFKCEHCFTEAPSGKNVKERLDIDTVARVADEADELGIFEFDLQGGELLIDKPYLYEVIKAIKPERFYLYITTNGYLLDEETAKTFAKLGVSRVSVSIDSMNPTEHDIFRGHKGAWQRAIDALKYVKEAGMEPYLNITVGHYNAFSEDVEKLCQYSKEQGYTTLVNVAVPSGNWHSMEEIMCDEKDTAHLIELRKKYKNMIRDLWNPFDKKNEAVLGCNTVNRIYITPIGDVLVCPYVHIKIGNIFENSLKEIVKYGHSIKHFRNYNPLCMAGEDREFVNKYLKTPGIGVFRPLDAKKIFKEEDYVEK